MAHISKPASTARKRYQPQSGTKAKTSIGVPAALLTLINILISVGAQPVGAQVSSSSSAQQSFLNKLVQLQTTIDAADADIKNEISSARTDMLALDLSRLKENIKADRETRDRLFALSADIAMTAITWPTAPIDEQVNKIADFAGRYGEIGKSLLLTYQDDSKARQQVAQAAQKLAAAKAAMTTLQQLKSDRSRLASEGQKTGLLPNVTYDSKSGTFSVTSPPRAQAVASNAQIAQAPANPAPPAIAASFVIPTKPDALALALLYEVVLFSKDSQSVERLSTRSAANSFAKCMIEHRTTNTIRPNELWEFLTHSAYILRAKNAVGAFWPQAQRFRTFPNRKDFEFTVKLSTLKITQTPVLKVNALVPASYQATGLTGSVISSQNYQMGFSEPDVCMPATASRPQRQVSPDDDE